MSLRNAPLRSYRHRTNLVSHDAAVCVEGYLDVPARADHLRNSALLDSKRFRQHGLSAVRFQILRER